MTHSIPDDCVAVGVPTKVIGNTWDYARKTQENMPANWNEDKFRENKREYLLNIIESPKL